MSTPTLGDRSELPLVPLKRDARCPLHPPAAFAQWRESEGLQSGLDGPRVSADVHTFNEQPGAREIH